MASQSYPPVISASLSFALESGRQIAFDWFLLEDRLHFTTEARHCFNDLAIDIHHPWRSADLPPFIHPADRERLFSHLRAALKAQDAASGTLYRVELRLKDERLGWRWVDISGKIIARDDAGRALRMIGAFSDIDERKRTELRLERLRRLYAALSRINQAFICIEEQDALFRSICTILVDECKLREGWIGVFGPGEKVPRVLAAAGINASDAAQSIRQCGEHPAITARRTQRAAFLRTPAAATAAGAQNDAPIEDDLIAAFPFQSADQGTCMLTLRAGDPDFFDGESIALVEQIAADISFALHHRSRIAQRASMEKSLLESVFTAFVRDITQRDRQEQLQVEQNRILNLVATGTPLPHLVEEIRALVEFLCPGARCSITVPQAGRPAGHARLPSPNRDVSARNGESLSRDTRHLLPAGTGARETAATPAQPCWTWPIAGRHTHGLGSITVCFADARQPTEAEREVLDSCARLAGIAIESRISEEKIRRLAHYDGLTNLPNRFLFREFLELAQRHAQRTGKRFAVLFIDLDKFKEVNDTHGHEAGDHVLKEVAARLRGVLRNSDQIARMGGDEFYVLIEDLEDSQYAARVAEKLRDEAARPIAIGSAICAVSASIGISIYPDDDQCVDTLLKNADHAMYRAKHRGKNTFAFFSAEQEQRASALRQS